MAFHNVSILAKRRSFFLWSMEEKTVREWLFAFHIWCGNCLWIFVQRRKKKHPCEEVLTDDFSAWINFKTILNSLSLFLFLRLSMWIWTCWYFRWFLLLFMWKREKRETCREWCVLNSELNSLYHAVIWSFNSDCLQMFSFCFYLNSSFQWLIVRILFIAFFFSVSKRAWACNQILFCFMFIYLVLFKI